MPKENKITFIICVNDDLYYSECTFYINQLVIPEGYKTEIISIRDAESMCSAYNAGMKESDAKYKIYLHQDVFIRNKNFLSDILNIFKNDSSIGMIGMIGGNDMPMVGTWNTGLVDVRNPSTPYYVLGRKDWNGSDVEVEAVDGILIATQYDLPWREDLFTHFDFYDVSQSFEMRKAGYKVIVPYQKEPWVIHDCGYEKLKYFNEERHICMKEYPEYFYSDNGADIIFNEEWSQLNAALSSEIKELITQGRWDEVREILNSYNQIDKKSNGLDTDMVRLGVIYELYKIEHEVEVPHYFFEAGMTYQQILEKYNKTRFLLRRMELGMDESLYPGLIQDIVDMKISLPALYILIIHSIHYREYLIQRLRDIYKRTGNDICVTSLENFSKDTLKKFPPIVQETEKCTI